MAIGAERIKTVASWGFLGEPGPTQIIGEPVGVTLTCSDLLAVTLETDEITVEIDEG